MWGFHTYPEMSSAWSNAMLSTFIISVVPNVLLYLIPVEFLSGTVQGINVKAVMLSFASGGLMGDVFLHILPHSLGGHSHDHGHGGGHGHGHVHSHNHHDNQHHGHDHDHHHHHHGGNCCHKGLWNGIMTSLKSTFLEDKSMMLSLSLLFGFFLFFVIERLNSRKDCHNHDSGTATKVVEDKKEEEDGEEPKARRRSRSRSQSRSRARVKSPAPARKPKRSAACNEEGAKGVLPWASFRLTPGAYLNILADVMHNFTDGVAIGATFAATGGKWGMGLATSLSVLMHEIPHEVGDFVVLVKSGLSKQQAIQTQFVTALGAFLGTVVGLLSHSSEAIQQFLVSTAAGGFLYLATVNMLGGNITQNASSHAMQGVYEAVAFALGVVMMMVVCFLE